MRQGKLIFAIVVVLLNGCSQTDFRSSSPTNDAVEAADKGSAGSTDDLTEDVVVITDGETRVARPLAWQKQELDLDVQTKWLAWHSLQDAIRQDREGAAGFSLLEPTVERAVAVGIQKAVVESTLRRFPFVADATLIDMQDASTLADEIKSSLVKRPLMAKRVDDPNRVNDMFYLAKPPVEFPNDQTKSFDLLDELYDAKLAQQVQLEADLSASESKLADIEYDLEATRKDLKEARTCRFADPAYQEPMTCYANDPARTPGTWHFSAKDHSFTGPCGKQFIFKEESWFYNGEHGPQSCAPGDRCFSWDFYDRTYTNAHSRHSVVIKNYDSAACYLVTTRSGVGCFDEESRITMADQTTKAAKDIAPGDMLWNPVQKRPVRVKRVVFGPEKHAMYEVGVDPAHVTKVTRTHVFPTARGLKQARELVASDRLQDKNGNFVPLRILRKLPVDPSQNVWNFAIAGDKPEDKLILADGVVTGDLSLQEQLEFSVARD